MAGPDWVMVPLVVFLITSINVIVLFLLQSVGWIYLLISSFSALLLLTSYLAIAFTEPGIVYRTAANTCVQTPLGQPPSPSTGTELGAMPGTGIMAGAGATAVVGYANSTADSAAGATVTAATTAVYVPAVPPPLLILCSQCNIMRPVHSRHCYHCDACIENLDHHCP